MHMPCLYVKYHGISQGTLLVEKSLAGVYIPERPPQEATPHAMIGISQTTFLSSQRILCWVIYATLRPLCIPANALVSSHSGQRGPCFALWALRCGFATTYSYGAYSFFCWTSHSFALLPIHTIANHSPRSTRQGHFRAPL